MSTAPKLSRRRFLGLLGAGLAAPPAAGLLGGCSAAGASGRETLKIGVLTPLSGPLSATGTLVSNSLAAAIHHLNSTGGLSGRKVEILLRDTGAGSANTLRVYHELVTTARPVALLWCGSPGIEQVQDDILRRGLPVVAAFTDLYSPGLLYPSTRGPGRSVFQVTAPLAHRLDALAAYAGSDRGYSSAGLLHDPSLEPGGDLVGQFRRAFGAAGVRIVAEEVFPTGATDVGPQVERLGSAAPDLLYLAGAPADVATVVEQIAASGASYLDDPAAKGPRWRPQIFGSLAGLGDGTWASDAGQAAKVGTVTTTQLSSLPYLPTYTVRQWMVRYLGTEPVGGEDAPADALWTVLQGVKRAGSTDRRRLVRAIEGMQALRFASLRFGFDPRRHLATTAGDVATMTLEYLQGPETTDPAYELGREWDSGQLYGAQASAMTQLVRPTLAANRGAHPDVVAMIMSEGYGTQCTKLPDGRLSDACKVH